MLGKAMRIVTMCTLTFAICGERLGDTSGAVLSKTPTNRRLFAKSLLLGASVHAASGFGQPAHAASGFRRVLKAATILDVKRRKDVQSAEHGDKGAIVTVDHALAPWSATLESAKRDEPLKSVGGFFKDGPHAPSEDWEEWGEEFFSGGEDRRLEALFLSEMADKGKKILAKINGELVFTENEAEWKALEDEAREDDVREFQQWQEQARELYVGSYKVHSTPAGPFVLDTLLSVINDPVSKALQAQREVKAETKAETLSDVVDAAEHGDEGAKATIDHALASWSAMLDGAKRLYAEKEKRDAQARDAVEEVDEGAR